MDKSFHIVLGMTIAYAASLLGMFVAWWAYRKRTKQKGEGKDDGSDS